MCKHECVCVCMFFYANEKRKQIWAWGEFDIYFPVFIYQLCIRGTRVCITIFVNYINFQRNKAYRELIKTGSIVSDLNNNQQFLVVYFA